MFVESFPWIQSNLFQNGQFNPRNRNLWPLHLLIFLQRELPRKLPSKTFYTVPIPWSAREFRRKPFWSSKADIYCWNGQEVWYRRATVILWAKLKLHETRLSSTLRDEYKMCFSLCTSSTSSSSASGPGVLRVKSLKRTKTCGCVHRYREETTLCAQKSSGYNVDRIKRNDLGQSFTIQESRDLLVEYLPNNGIILVPL